MNNLAVGCVFFFFSFKFLGLELGVLLGMLVVYNYSPLKLPSTPRVGRWSYVYTYIYHPAHVL